MTLSIASRVGLILGAFVLLGVALVGTILTKDSLSVLREQSLNELDASVRQSERAYTAIIDGAVRDLQLLMQARDVRDFARIGRLDRERVLELLESMLLKQPWYAQVRLIGAGDNGRELARVDRRADGAWRVPAEQLQQKGHRAYVHNALTLPAGQVYLSRITLNREHGQISKPEQPVLRVATPVYGNAGALGVLVINIDMQAVFQRMVGDLPAGDRLLVANGDGEFLLHPQAHKAFAFERGESHRVQDEFPGTAKIQSNPGVVLHEISQGSGIGDMPPSALAVTSVPMPRGSAEPFVTIAVSEPLARVEADVRALLERSFLITGPLGVMAAAVALLLAWQMVKPLRAVTHAVEAYRLGRGFEGRLPVNRHDEIGQLARSVQDMDQRIQTQMRWLHDEHERLDSLFETAADAILVIDQFGVIERCNSAASRLFGYAVDELVGNNVSMLMNEQDAGQHDGYLRNYLQTGDGKIIGIGREVTGRHKDGQVLPLYLSIGEFEVGGERRFTGILHDISERLALEEELRHKASTDTLTGIYNRRYFMDQLEREQSRAQRYDTNLALMLIDLDYFKEINDSHGHPVGDQALCRAVALLSQELRSHDVLARLGGDEFAVLLPETTMQTACTVAQRLCDKATKTKAVDHPPSYLGFSIGVAQYSGREDAAALLRRADAALYRAKEDGRGQIACDPCRRQAVGQEA